MLPLLLHNKTKYSFPLPQQCCTTIIFRNFPPPLSKSSGNRYIYFQDCDAGFRILETFLMPTVQTLAALMSSSARHSAMDLMFRNADSRAPVQSSQTAWFTRLRGDTSTAWRRTVPARPIRVESSRGPLLMMAFTNTCRGFWKKKNKKKGLVNTR